MPFVQLFYHLVWATKDRQPLLLPALEPVVHVYLRAKATGLGGVLFALNGAEDHVHMVVSVPPRIALATFIGQVKAVASTRVNRARPGEVQLLWQGEYGAFSFDARHLPHIVAYVEKQKQHHAENRTIPILECSGPVSRRRCETQAAHMSPTMPRGAASSRVGCWVGRRMNLRAAEPRRREPSGRHALSTG